MPVLLRGAADAHELACSVYCVCGLCVGGVLGIAHELACVCCTVFHTHTTRTSCSRRGATS